MATLYSYTCTKCGYKFRAPEKGYDRFMMGWIGYFSCKHCKELISLHIPEITWEERGVRALHSVLGEIQKCPKCGKMDLKPWKSECKCPRCNGVLFKDDYLIMAD